VSANNETIGDVNDVLLDRSGAAQAIVIGVGGFLGIGEKDVAVPFGALEFASSRDAETTSSTSAAAAPAGASSGGADTAAARARTASADGGASAPRSGSDFDRIVLRLTKGDLQAAPTFRSSARATSAGAGANNAAR
jgi:hypothetical protein